jgi:hypothetical protein
MRKPHVFISSRLRLGKVRSQIRDLLLSTGFEPEIYEKDSTPSSEPTTYLKDVVDADFVIFVLDETYGTPRAKTGRSGVHEEWSLVIEEGIPYHVYLKRASGKRIERALRKFIKEELMGREISFFYYSNSSGLLRQVKSSIARMTLDIARSARYRSRLGNKAMVADMVEYEYKNFIEWDQAILQVSEYEGMITGVTNAWGFLADHFPSFNPELVGPFYDSKLQELFAQFLHKVNLLSQHDSSQTVNPHEGPELRFPGGLVRVDRFAIARPCPHDFFEKHNKLKNDALRVWKQIGARIRARYTRYFRSK